MAAGLLVLAGVCAYVYRDAFQPPEILVTHRVVTGPPIRGLSRTNQDLKITQLAFALDRKCKLTEIKVIPVPGSESNSNSLPVWHVISDSNSIPVKAFAYGDHIRGLRPLVRKQRAMPLESNVTYRLIVRAGRELGQHDFTVGQEIVATR